jgi:phage terminase large subunit GpA-like protein
MDAKILEIYAKAVADAWDADPVVTVSEWADAKRILPQKAAAEPGPYRTARTPYMREIMDCLSVTSPVQDVTLMAGAQVGKSEAGNNWVGYVIDHAPGPMLLVQPTVDAAKRYSKQRIGPMISESPALSGKVTDNKSRDSSNTMLEKEFPGGILLLGGANSAAGLRSMPIRYLFADEISNWPLDVDGEGDPLSLSVARTTTFARRKVYKCSTPGVKGVCRIEAEYLKTDQRRYHVPCPHCGELHVLSWANFRIPKGKDGNYLPKLAHMVCPSCGGVIEERHKDIMLPEEGFGGRARWIATAPELASPIRRGYHINALYSPIGWKSWADIAQQWLDAQGNPTLLQTFVNNVLAETWEVRGERLSDHELAARVEDYAADPLPDGVVLLTAGTDVQPDRIETEVVGWGLGEESWSIDYIVTYGNPDLDDVWALHDANVLNRVYRRADGVQLRVARCCVDTGGANTDGVYRAVRARLASGVLLGTKGVPGEGKPIIGNPSHSNLGKIPLFPVGTFTAKDLVMGRLRIDEPGPGYCHFPRRYRPEYFKGLTAEEVRVKFKKGFPSREWHKVYDRNEPLDCRVLATAALASLNVRIDELVAAAGAAPAGRRVRGVLEPD